MLCPTSDLCSEVWKKSCEFVNITLQLVESNILSMRYTEDETGLLNNFAVEPKMYQAEPPTGAEKRNYIILGSIAASLIVGLFFIAASVS